MLFFLLIISPYLTSKAFLSLIYYYYYLIFDFFSNFIDRYLEKAKKLYEDAAAKAGVTAEKLNNTYVNPGPANLDAEVFYPLLFLMKSYFSYLFPTYLFDLSFYLFH